MTLGSVGAGERSGSRTNDTRSTGTICSTYLSGAVVGQVELLFGRSMISLEEVADGVSVTFSDGERREFALVFGCDGNRSNTRKLLFGDGEQFTYFMGGYFFLKVVPQTGLLSCQQLGGVQRARSNGDAQRLRRPH